jgi:ABC-type molybdenum transport system ATPase subunit/photorepair protein PhrA/GNAT superfamily N-acetyltransferase
VHRTPRVLQVEGLFDLPATGVSEMSWSVSLPLDDKPWHLGLLVGPSGCGKSTIARHLWPAALSRQVTWPGDRAVLDAFPHSLAIKDIVALLSSVGFSSPPAWLRPFHVLSTGQQFRVTLARLLAECPELAVLDEFTSTVDRTVAQIGSYALSKTVRSRRQKFVAITCHEDVEAWLNPDWVYRPATNTFTWRCLQPRPQIALCIRRVGRELWPLFKPHHYLSTSLAPGAICFGAFWGDRPVAFSAWINALTARGGKREHRTVTLPDYQGAGIGHALSTHIAALWKALGQRATSTTTHPAMIAARQRSRHWRMVRAPSLANGHSRDLPGLRHAVTRLTAGFEYVGPPLETATARRMMLR